MAARLSLKATTPVNLALASPLGRLLISPETCTQAKKNCKYNSLSFHQSVSNVSSDQSITLPEEQIQNNCTKSYVTRLKFPATQARCSNGSQTKVQGNTTDRITEKRAGNMPKTTSFPQKPPKRVRQQCCRA